MVRETPYHCWDCTRLYCVYSDFPGLFTIKALEGLLCCPHRVTYPSLYERHREAINGLAGDVFN